LAATYGFDDSSSEDEEEDPIVQSPDGDENHEEDYEDNTVPNTSQNEVSRGNANLDMLDKYIKRITDLGSVPHPYNRGQEIAIMEGKRLTPFPTHDNCLFEWRVVSTPESIRFNRCFWLLMAQLDQLSSDSNCRSRRFAKRVVGRLDPITGRTSRKFNTKFIPQWLRLGKKQLIRLVFP
jgi:hypothetical protein